VLANVAGLVALAMLLPVAGRGVVAVAVIGVALLVSGISRSIVFTGMSSLTFTALGPSMISAGNVLASISMQMFNALGVSLTALALSLSARAGARADPVLWDFRVTLALMLGVGIAATVLVWRHLPRQLAELHREKSD